MTFYRFTIHVEGIPVIDRIVTAEEMRELARQYDVILQFELIFARKRSKAIVPCHDEIDISWRELG